MKRELARTTGNLSLAQLRALEAVVRTGSFTDAAKEIGVSQPSISNHIQGLESRFKTKLLVKSGYSVSATPVLVSLLPRIRALLALAGDLETELSHHRALAAGELRIGYSTYQLAIPIISSFMAKHPTISIEARALASQDIINLIETGSLDIGFITGREIPAGLEGELILKTRIVLAVPPEHPLAKRTALPGKTSPSFPSSNAKEVPVPADCSKPLPRLPGQDPRPHLLLLVGVDRNAGQIRLGYRCRSGSGNHRARRLCRHQDRRREPQRKPLCSLAKRHGTVAAIEAFRAGLPAS